jgi:beta-lactam-binding protein with PASTA domain
VDRSRINAEVVLKSNELNRGRIIFEPSPFLNLVKELRYQGKPIDAGVRVPKGSVIDLVIGDGNGSADFTIGNLVGDAYEQALFKITGWNLHLGDVEIPEDGDTTGIIPFVYKQLPLPGDSVRVGDPVTLWIAPKGYKEPDEEIEEDN